MLYKNRLNNQTDNRIFQAGVDYQPVGF